MLIHGKHYHTVWHDPADPEAVQIIDQSKLPFRFETLRLDSVAGIAAAISEMKVRGAGCIGATAAWGMYLAAREAPGRLQQCAAEVMRTRPTAVNLAWAVRRQLDLMQNLNTAEEKVAAAAVHDQLVQVPAGNRHDALVHAFVLRFEQPFAWPEFAEAIDVLLATCGDRILRVKGLIAVQGENGPRVLQCVQHMRYPEAMLPAWPDGDQQSRLVFIVRALAQDIVSQAFAMFCGVSALPCSR